MTNPMDDKTIEAEFDKEFPKTKVCRACGQRECERVTTGCPWYQDTFFLNDNDEIKVKEFIRKALTTQKSSLLAQIEEWMKDKEKYLKMGTYVKECNESGEIKLGVKIEENEFELGEISGRNKLLTDLTEYLKTLK